MNFRVWRFIARRVGLLLATYSLLRLMFFFHNHALFSDASSSQIIRAFVYGLRFDLSALAIINAPFVVLTFLSWRCPPARAYQRLLKAVFVLVNFPFLIINLIDLEFFQFNGRRMDPLLLGVTTDAGVNLRTIALSYWPLLALGLFMLVVVFLAYGRTRPKDERPLKRMNYFFWALNLLVAIGLIVLAIRGGTQMKPITLAEAAIFNHGGLTQLALNSSFTVIKARRWALKPQHFFDRPEEVREILRPLVGGEKLAFDPGPRDNVIIIIVESLSLEYCGMGNGGNRYTPFLDSLAERALFFPRHFANGRRSAEAVASILAGLPSLMDPWFTESPYCDLPLLGLGRALAPGGYTSSFFHGAPNGTFRFDVFTGMAGIQNYFGLKEYPNRADYDGSWGILDEPYLQYVIGMVSKQKPPFAAVAFTLSSHNPYIIPPQHKGRFKKGPLGIHESIGYLDYALEQFFATAQKQSWYSNTVFVITGDHTQKLETPEYMNALGLHRVPLLLFHPAKKFPAVDTQRVVQQTDILPSLLDYLGIQPDRKLLFGHSVFRGGEGQAFFREQGHYWLVRGNYALEFSPEFGSRLFDWDKDVQLQSPLNNEPELQKQMEREAQAFIQYYNNGLLERNIYDPTGTKSPTNAVSVK
jgi:phosphoglycerol transferase MdoB-like AlkP superfamily enzyme